MQTLKEVIETYKKESEKLALQFHKGLITFMEFHNIDCDLTEQCKNTVFDIVWHNANNHENDWRYNENDRKRLIP